MRVAFVIPRLEPGHGGVERYAFGLASGLARRGVCVRAFTTTPPERLPPRPPGFDVEPVSVPPGPRARREPRFAAAAARRLAAHPAWHVVQSFGAALPAGGVGGPVYHRIGGGSHAAYLAARGRFEPVLRAWIRRARPLHRDRIARQRAAWRDPRVRLVANSRFARDHVCADAGIPAEDVAVLHNGVDVEAFRPERDPGRIARARAGLGLDPGSLAVAFVGSGFVRKGLRFAIGMLARARCRGARVELLVAGRGAATRYRRQARRLGVADAVHFAGAVDPVERVYAACDVFLLPSLYEPFSNAALEALACGLPLLVTGQSGTAEIVAEGREAHLLATPDSIEAGGEMLRAWAAEPERRRAMGERARRTAEGLDQRAHVERVMALYREAAQPARVP